MNGREVGMTDKEWDNCHLMRKYGSLLQDGPVKNEILKFDMTPDLQDIKVGAYFFCSQWCSIRTLVTGIACSGSNIGARYISDGCINCENMVKRALVILILIV